MKLILTTAILTLTLAGCASDQNLDNTSILTQPRTCTYLERDLTKSWNNRIYYCVPKDYHGEVKVHTSPDKITSAGAVTNTQSIHQTKEH